MIDMEKSESIGPTERAIIALAAAEGHDADIPTNAGVTARHASHAQNKEFGPDLEKEAAPSLREASSTTSEDDSETVEEATDPNIISWAGETDPENPLNWPLWQKWSAILVVSGITFLAPLGSSLVAPGVPQLMTEFDSSNDLLASFVVSVYVLGFALGPLVIAPLSEMYGRLPLYHSCNVLYIICCIACALSTNLSMLIGFRFLAGTFGSAPLTLGGGTIADLTFPMQRGKAMTLWMLGPTVGPVIGPVCGGFISGSLGWRWCFWIVSIAAGVITGLAFLLMRETYAPTILQKRVNRLRKETGNTKLRSKLDSGLTGKDLFLYSIVRPTKMLIFSPICLLISIYVAITYSYLYIFFTTFTIVFETEYGFSRGIVGLTFLGMGSGQLIGQSFYILFGDKFAKKHMKAGTFKPEHRLPLMAVGAFLIPIGLFWYGWAVQAHTHWIVPLIGASFFGCGLIMSFMPAGAYLIDAFTKYAASAMAANTVLRSLAAAVLPLAGQDMYATLGYGWGNSLLAFVAVAFIPVPFIFYKYGERIRLKYRVEF